VDAIVEGPGGCSRWRHGNCTRLEDCVSQASNSHRQRSQKVTDGGIGQACRMNEYCFTSPCIHDVVGPPRSLNPSCSIAAEILEMQ
jgi:hypothetical protein